MECPHCQATIPQGHCCPSCRRFAKDLSGTVHLVTYTRRFLGDVLLEAILILGTLFVGWFVWLVFTARTSQTPAKRLLKIYVVDATTATTVSPSKLWVREYFVKLMLLPAVSVATTAAGFLVDGMWVFFDKRRQALHDKIMSTHIAHAPQGMPQPMQHPAFGTRTGFFGFPLPLRQPTHPPARP